MVLPEAVPSIVIENALSDADSGDNQPAAHWESPSLRILLAHFEHIDDPERAPRFAETAYRTLAHWLAGSNVEQVTATLDVLQPIVDQETLAMLQSRASCRHSKSIRPKQRNRLGSRCGVRRGCGVGYDGGVGD